MRDFVLCILFVALSLTGCSKPRAGGDFREVTVMADERAWVAAESALVEGLERKVLLLDEESVFWVHHLSVDAIETIRRRPLLVFLATLDGRGPVTDMVSALTGKDLSVLAEEAPFTRLLEPWASHQVAYVLVAHTASELDSLASTVVGMLYDDFFDRYRTVVRERLYVRGEDNRLVRELTSRYGWSIRVPRPWGMEEKPEERWVHFVKTDPDRHVSVYWEDWAEDSVSPEFCVRTRRDLAWRHYDEDEIDDSRTHYSPVEFLGYPAIEIRGAWTNQKYTAGGPFRTICFVVEEQQRFYLIDLVTFAPDRPKFYVMTQLDMVAETFVVSPPGANAPGANYGMH
ncbi:DUF4837 family protein [Candidatus Fermentibacteria bacterium]|nr:DUF4837 family protein [Candidatus Fermentibacteria bacterium]